MNKLQTNESMSGKSCKSLLCILKSEDKYIWQDLKADHNILHLEDVTNVNKTYYSNNKITLCAKE